MYRGQRVLEWKFLGSMQMFEHYDKQVTLAMVR